MTNTTLLGGNRTTKFRFSEKTSYMTNAKSEENNTEKSISLLDPDQMKIVALNRGFYAVLAGAGSGKSTVLLARSTRLSREFSQSKILTVTFTSEAAKNLRNRMAKLAPHSNADGLFSTLHALALRFAYEHTDAFPFKLADNLLATEDLSARAVFDSIGDKINFKAFTSWVSLQKRKRVSPAEAIVIAGKNNQKIDYAIGYKRYQGLLRKQGILDFDDLIYHMVDILSTRPDIRQLWQYDFVQQDEAQDACELDWRLLQLITEKHKNLLCVGDAGQSLYGFRGGESHHLINMADLFPGTKTLYMGNNYRSTHEIVEFGKEAYPFPTVASHFTSKRGRLGVSPTITPYSTESREAIEVAAKITDPNNTAILARTNLALRPFEEALLDTGVPYHVLGDSGFWETKEVQNVLYYLRCAVSLTDNAVTGAIRSPFWPTKFVKKKKVLEEIKQFQAKGLTAWDAVKQMPELNQFRQFVSGLFHLKNLPTDQAISFIITQLKAVEHYREEADLNPDSNPLLNLKELVRASKRYDIINEFLSFLRRLTHSRNSRKGVCLSTIHSAKGREWKEVFLVSVNEGILPHSKSENEEEERCCFFVGVSRAEDKLHISYYGTPSRFLNKWLTSTETLSDVK